MPVGLAGGEGVKGELHDKIRRSTVRKGINTSKLIHNLMDQIQKTVTPTVGGKFKFFAQPK